MHQLTNRSHFTTDHNEFGNKRSLLSLNQRNEDRKWLSNAEAG